MDITSALSRPGDALAAVRASAGPESASSKRWESDGSREQLSASQKKNDDENDG